MVTHKWKNIRQVLMIFTILLMVTGAVGGIPTPVRAGPVAEGTKPSRPEQANFALVDRISAGASHSCAIKSDGTLACWGDNTYGQSTPPSGVFTQISAGSYHTCGLKTDGTLACWGRNIEGQSTPAAGIFTQVSAGGWHTCGLRSDGSLSCWGDNTYSQSIPPSGTFTQVRAGAYHTCGLKRDGTLACWGAGETNTGTSPEYGQSIPPGGIFTQINAGAFHTCGVKSDGTGACWGKNSSGQSTVPGGTFTQVNAGSNHSCGLKSDGTLACWGSNNYSQSTPPAGTFTQVSAGDYHNCGLKSDGTLACWGYNSSGQSTPPGVSFGRTDLSAGWTFTCELKSDGTIVCWGAGKTNSGINFEYGQSIPPSGTFSQISANSNHACGIKSDGTLACWGLNGDGQSTPPSGTFLQVSAGDWNACGVRSNGTLACWGYDGDGQSTAPTGTFTQVRAYQFHTCGVRTNGTLACWGRNGDGQSTPPTGTFTQVISGIYYSCGLRTDGSLACWGVSDYGLSTPPGGTFTQISGGDWHACGLKSDGTLACWGAGATNTGVAPEFGQSIPPSGTFTEVSAGSYHTCGLRSDGTLTCWGRNDYGQSLPFSISGSVGVAGATLGYTDGTPKTVTSGPDGTYEIAIPYGWSGTVTPSLTGYVFSPASKTYTGLLANQTNQNYGITTWPSWYGGAVITADQNVIAVGRPHIGSEVASYGSFSGGSSMLYVPMLFKQMWGSYDSALYVQNTDPSNSASVTIKFYDPDGNLNCTKTDTIPKLSSHGYWLPDETCLPASWYGGVVITSDRALVAVGRPHIGNQVMTYNGFSGGSATMYVPMLFKQMWGYDSAFYVQNTDPSNSANVTIKFYDPDGTLNCTKTDTIPELSSHGYWLPSESCLPDSWYGGVVVTADRNIVAVGRPHLGSEITTYNGFAVGSTNMYAPMLFKQAFGSYDSALYVQNVGGSAATVTLKFYNASGVLACSVPDTISMGASKGYWLPSISCLPNGWIGSVKVESSRPVVVIARPHLGSSVTAYDGFPAGGTAASVPMLFKQMWGSYDSALFVENTSATNTANVIIKFYDVNGNLSCMRNDIISTMGVWSYWLPSMTCNP
jgi:alpha-tubulin suppressor-like RCC1 family protein